MSNRGIDPVDTLLGGMGSIFSRILVWFGAGAVAILLVLIGVWLHDAIGYIRMGVNPIDFDYLPTFKEIIGGLLLLPVGWLLMILVGFTHWVGQVFIPFAVFGTIMFLWTEYLEEELFFLNLLITPWTAILLAARDAGSFPWGALLVLVPWTVTVSGVWWMRSRSGIEADFREQERVTILSASEILAGTTTLMPPPDYDEIHRPTHEKTQP